MRLSGQTVLAQKPPANVSNAAKTEQMSVTTDVIHMRRLVPALPITWKMAPSPRVDIILPVQWILAGGTCGL